MNLSTSSLFSQLLSLIDRSRFARLVKHYSKTGFLSESYLLLGPQAAAKSHEIKHLGPSIPILAPLSLAPSRPSHPAHHRPIPESKGKLSYA